MSENQLYYHRDGIYYRLDNHSADPESEDSATIRVTDSSGTQIVIEGASAENLYVCAQAPNGVDQYISLREIENFPSFIIEQLNLRKRN